MSVALGKVYNVAVRLNITKFSNLRHFSSIKVYIILKLNEIISES